MNKKIYVGGGSFPCGGIFSMWAVFSPRRGHAIFSGGGALLGLPPITILREPIVITNIFNLSGSWMFDFFGGGAIRSAQKTCPPPLAPIKINNLCPPPPPHSQYFSFSHYYLYPITPPPALHSARIRRVRIAVCDAFLPSCESIFKMVRSMRIIL